MIGMDTDEIDHLVGPMISQESEGIEDDIQKMRDRLDSADSPPEEKLELE